MNPTPPLLRWLPTALEPFPGVRLTLEGGVETPGETSRHSWTESIEDVRVGDLLVNKEPGNYSPVVIDAGAVRNYLIYRDGQWYKALPEGSEEGVFFSYMRPSNPFRRARREPTPTPALAVASTSVRSSSDPVRTTPVTTATASETPIARGRGAVLSVVVLLLLVGGVSALFVKGSPLAGTVGPTTINHFYFNEANWKESQSYHTFATSSLLHTDPIWLAYTVVGLVVFGGIVGRNVGVIRTTAVFLVSGAVGLGVWQLSKTETGQDIYFRYLGKAFEWVLQQAGPEAAFTALILIDQVWNHIITLSGAAWGSAGGIAGLIAFGMMRRDLIGSRTHEVKWVLLLLLGPIALLFVFRRSVSIRATMKTILMVPLVATYAIAGLYLREAYQPATVVPYIVMLGGVIGGWAFVFPDRLFRETVGFVRDKAIETTVQSATGAAERRAA